MAMRLVDVGSEPQSVLALVRAERGAVTPDGLVVDLELVKMLRAVRDTGPDGPGSAARLRDVPGYLGTVGPGLPVISMSPTAVVAGVVPPDTAPTALAGDVTEGTGKHDNTNADDATADDADSPIHDDAHDGASPNDATQLPEESSPPPDEPRSAEEPPSDHDAEDDDGPPLGSRLAIELNTAAPAPGLVERLTDLAVAVVDDDALVEIIAGWERIAAWAFARQAASIEELANRRYGHGDGDFVGAEVAARLAMTPRAAEAKVELALALSMMPSVFDALDAGQVDLNKARIATRETDGLSRTDRNTVHDTVMPEAENLTGPQLRAKLRKAAIQLDGEHAARRAARAAKERNVTLTPESDTMASLTMYAPAADAETVFTALDAIAHACDPDDPRSLGARRADALTHVARWVLGHGTGPDGLLGTAHGFKPTIHVTVGAGTLLGLENEPAELAGYGPIPPDVARAIAKDATWEAIFVEAGTGEFLERSTNRYRPGKVLAAKVITRDQTCTFPGCTRRAVRADLDHEKAYDPTLPPSEQTTDSNLHALCRRHHRMKTRGRWKVRRDPVTGNTYWTAPTGHRYTRRAIIPAGYVPRGRKRAPMPDGSRGPAEELAQPDCSAADDAPTNRRSRRRAADLGTPDDTDGQTPMLPAADRTPATSLPTDQAAAPPSSEGAPRGAGGHRPGHEKLSWADTDDGEPPF